MSVVVIDNDTYDYSNDISLVDRIIINNTLPDMFFVDKYSPRINKVNTFFNKEKLEVLRKMSKDKEVPNMLFFGPSGCGKMTLAYQFLEMIFGKGVYALKDISYKIHGSSNAPKDITIKQSDYHIVIEPKNTNFDRFIIKDVIEKYIRTDNFVMMKKGLPFKVVMIDNTDNLSYYAQTSLRRTIELYSHKCKFIMKSRSSSKILGPVMSRCCKIRVQAPEKSELYKYLCQINALENINLKYSDIEHIINYCEGNIKKALWMMNSHKEYTYLPIISDANTKKIFDCVHSIHKNIFLDFTIVKNNINIIFEYLNEIDTQHDIKCNINKYKLKLKKDLSVPSIEQSYTDLIKNHFDTMFDNINRIKYKNNKEIAAKKNIIQSYENTVNSAFYIFKSYQKQYGPSIIFDDKIDIMVDLLCSCDINNANKMKDYYYNTMITNFEPSEIISNIMCKLLTNDKIDKDKHRDIIKICSLTEHNILRGRHNISHLDMFTAKIMHLLSK